MKSLLDRKEKDRVSDKSKGKFTTDDVATGASLQKNRSGYVFLFISLRNSPLLLCYFDMRTIYASDYYKI